MADKKDPQPTDEQEQVQQGSGEETPSVVPMAEFLKVKKGLEKELGEKEKSHAGVVETLNAQVNELSNSKLQLETKLQSLEEESGTAKATQEELTQVKQELEEARKRAEESSSKLFETKKSILLEKFKLPEDKLEGKTPDQLDLIEETLSAATISNSGYAVGGGSGAASSPSDPMDRYRNMISSEEKRSQPASVKEEE